MIVRNISRKITVCQTCDGSMSIDEDEDGLHLKCTMCSRSKTIWLPSIRIRTTRPSRTANPTFSFQETGMAGAD